MLPKTKSKPKHTLSDLTALVYGPSKIGKSTWCSKADDALFLATEPGLNALEVFQTPITCWDDLLQACAEIAEGKHEFKTIVVDTVDNAYKMCSDYVCKKFKIEHESDLGYGKGYALINNEFQRVINKLAFLPYGLILISHSQERDIETRTGKHTRSRFGCGLLNCRSGNRPASLATIPARSLPQAMCITCRSRIGCTRLATVSMRAMWPSLRKATRSQSRSASSM